MNLEPAIQLRSGGIHAFALEEHLAHRARGRSGDHPQNGPGAGAVTIVGDEAHEAERLAELLGGPDWAANPAIDVAGLTLSPGRIERSSAGTATEGEVEGTDVVVLVAKEPGLTPSLAATRRELAPQARPS